MQASITMRGFGALDEYKLRKIWEMRVHIGSKTSLRSDMRGRHLCKILHSKISTDAEVCNILQPHAEAAAKNIMYCFQDEIGSEYQNQD